MKIKGGISFYLADQCKLEEIVAYVKRAKRYGIDEAFTSFQYGNFRESDFLEVLKHCEKSGLSVMADVNKEVFYRICQETNNLQTFKEMGLNGIRLDYGFSLEEIAELSWNKQGLKIGINALLTDEMKRQFTQISFNKQQLIATFNYYPRPESGMSFEFFSRQCSFFEQNDIPVSVFVAGQTKKRGPLYAGLPTLEYQRYSHIPSSSSFFKQQKGVDTIYVGDSLIEERELKDFARSLEDDLIWIKVSLNESISTLEKELVLHHDHTLRMDESEWVLRSSTTRVKLQEEHKQLASAQRVDPRNRGSITLDNINYGRYMGELQILKMDLPPDERVNVVATIAAEDMYMLERLAGGTKIRLYIG